MGKSKRHTAIILCCASFLINKPAYAFWPVLDFGEIIPIVSNVTTSLDSLSQTKSQLTELKNSLKAIGDSIDTISQFSQDLRNNLDDIADIADESVGIVNDTLGTDINVQEGFTNAIDKVNNAQTDFVNNVVDQTQGALDKAESAADKGSSGIDAAQSAGADAEDFLNKAQEKTQKPSAGKDDADSQKGSDKLKKNFWENVNEKSEQISKAVEDANKALDEVEKAGLVDTDNLRDAMNDLNNAQENLTDIANEAKKSGVDLQEELKKAKEEDVLGQIKEDYTGKDSGNWLDKINKATEDLDQASERVNDALDDLEDTGLVDTGDVRDKINDLNEAQSGLAGTANDVVDKKEKVEEGYDKAKEKYKEFKEKRKKKKEAAAEQQEAVEEEEEEEEIPDTPDTKDMTALREEIKAGFAVARDENKKMAEQLNDIMDASINVLNKTAGENRVVLDELTQVIRDTDRLDKQGKKVLLKKIAELQVRRQQLSDRMIAVAESAKDEYNLEYQNKIADGIDNYEKVVERYLRGDASREEVFSAGEKLKEDATLLNVAPDKGVIAELNKDAEMLKSEFAALAAEIRKTEKKGKETVN